MTTKEITAKAAIELNLPPKLVWEVYKSYWAFIRNHISELPIKENLTKKEFDNLRTSINVPSLGKFYFDWEMLDYIKKKNERNKNSRADSTVHNCNNNS